MRFHWYSTNFIPSIGIQLTPVTFQHAFTLLSLFNFSSRTQFFQIIPVVPPSVLVSLLIVVSINLSASSLPNVLLSGI